MVLVQNEESMTTMTTESNYCMTSIRNMAQVDPVQHSAIYNVGSTSLDGENENYDINHDDDMSDDNVADNSTIQQLGDQPNTSVADVIRPPTPQTLEDRMVSPPIMEPQVAQPSPITQPQVRFNNNPPTNPNVNLTVLPSLLTAPPMPQLLAALPPTVWPEDLIVLNAVTNVSMIVLDFLLTFSCMPSPLSSYTSGLYISYSQTGSVCQTYDTTVLPLLLPATIGPPPMPQLLAAQPPTVWPEDLIVLNAVTNVSMIVLDSLLTFSCLPSPFFNNISTVNVYI
jgi:hypothetical protein